MERINKLASNKKMTKQEYVKWYFEQQGCQLLEEYTHTMKKMKYICKCGREAEVCWNKFTQRNRRCGFCSKFGRRIKYSFEEAKVIFQQLGCELLSKEFKGVDCPVDYKCSCGNYSKIRLSDLKSGYRCKKCGIEKQSGKNHWAWIKDRKKLRLKQIFRRKCHRALRSTLEAFGQEKIGHTTDWLGYGPKELQKYIESHHNWPNVKNKKWHLDHYFPFQAFIDYGIKDPKIINALENLQPITPKQNLQKKDKYDFQEFKDWLLVKGIII